MTSKYLRFRQIDPGDRRKTQVWIVTAARTDSPLGVVLWRSGWRQYVIEPEPMTVWSAGCLADVQAFIEGLMAARRAP